MRDVVVRQVQLHQDLEVLERVTVDLLQNERRVISEQKSFVHSVCHFLVFGVRDILGT